MPFGASDISEIPPNLVLTGFMGTGKTTIGHCITQWLGLPFYDTDHLISARAGMSIPEIFRRHGEAEFRRHEREVCAELASRRGQIIATGGGMLIDPANLQAMMKNGIVICLWASPEELQNRLTADPSRPLAGNWEALLEQRHPLYEAMPFQIVTTHRPPEEIAEEAIRIWRTHSL